MHNKVDTVRYGSPYFMYISSFFIVTNIFGVLCNNSVSFFSFLLFSVLIYFSVFRSRNTDGHLNEMTRRVSELIIAAAAVVSTAFETMIAHRVFLLSSDKASTASGMYVFAFALIITAFLCSFSGGYTVLKISNIAFIIPAAVFIIVGCSFFVGGLSFGKAAAGSDFDGVFESLISGASCALLLLSDSAIISFMQKSEKCYSKKHAGNAFIASGLLSLLYSILYSALFGKGIYSELSVPAVAAVGLIPGFDFEEVMLFAISVCVIFRFSCKICTVYSILSDNVRETHGKITVRLLTLMLFLSSAFAGTYMQSREGAGSFAAALVPLYLFAFVLLPLFTDTLKANK